MNNELGRKLTSLTLMTIMVAGGLTFAVPGVMPEAMAANANLFVSAENSQFGNTMVGPQVVEVVVIDNDINETNESNGEPDVTINGKKLRMAQATDGNWYGYFADKAQAQKADQTTISLAGGIGLDFGQFCKGTGSTKFNADETTVMFSDAQAVALPIRVNGTATTFGTNGTTTLVSCTTSFHGAAGGIGTDVDPTDDTVRISANSTHTIAYTVTVAQTTATESVNADVAGTVFNVVREAKKINQNSSTGNGIGQIGLVDDGLWPFVQLYDLTAGGNVVIKYNKGGGVQTTELLFDTYADTTESLDRSKYPQGSQVHFTVTDPWLNIDPTDEDSWTFDTSDTSSSSGYGTYYQMFDENGNSAGESSTSTSQTPNLSDNLTDLMAEEGVLKMTVDPQGTTAVIIVDNDNTNLHADCTTGVANCKTANSTLGAGTQPVTLTESEANSATFTTYDESDVSQLQIPVSATRGTSFTLSYTDDHTVLVGNSFASIDMENNASEWNGGVAIPIVVVDEDQNKNGRADEDLQVKSATNKTLIPALQTGDPFTLGENRTSAGAITITALFGTATYDGDGTVDLASDTATTEEVMKFSEVAILTPQSSQTYINTLWIDTYMEFSSLFNETIKDTRSVASERFYGINLVNLDVSGWNATGTYDVYILNGTNYIAASNTAARDSGYLQIGNNVAPKGIFSINGSITSDFDSNRSLNIPELLFGDATNAIDLNARSLGFAITHNSGADSGKVAVTGGVSIPVVLDFFSFGFTDDGSQSSERIANQIVRIEVEETGDNTSTFIGSLEYVMINQLNIYNSATYTSLVPIADDPTFIVIEDLTDEDSPRVNYLDLGSDGVATQIADQEAAPTHSGIVSFDNENYKVADTVTITLEDADLNTSEDLIDIYTVVTTASDLAYDAVGKASLPALSWGNLGRLLDVTFDDEQWLAQGQGSVTCSGPDAIPSGVDDGLGATNFSLIETGKDTGVFTGDFQIPSHYCKRSGLTTGVSTSVTGVDIEVNYVDFRDASGEIIEVGDGAGVRANTGSVTLDRTVYPVPFGVKGNFADSLNTSNLPNGRSIFPVHETGATSTGLASGEWLANGDLTIHVRVNDPDFDLSASGEDKIASNATAGVGPVKVSVIRGSSTVVLGHAGGPDALSGTINTGTGNINGTRQFGPMTEVSPDSGIFEIDIGIRYTDGPASTLCPTTSSFTALDGTTSTGVANRFDTSASSGNYCILQGDILQVEYTDPTDASGDVNTVTDSATFDLRNGMLQTDKSVYIIGSDIILTLIEPDFDLDNDAAETYDLDLIEWDSDAVTKTIGNLGGSTTSNGAVFDPEPSDFRETGDSTGIFQVVLEVPSAVNGDNLERGEEIVLEYTDWGPSGADYVGSEHEDANVTVYTSNFGATIELDQKVYTWTDKVYITVVAPDHNFDSNLIDEIGETTKDPIKISTRGSSINNYKLVETGTDTGIFTGEVILTGFSFDADGDTNTGTVTNGYDTTPTTTASSASSPAGPTNGKLKTTDDDGLTVSFEFSEDETVVSSALIRWNIGEAQWLEASYPASGTGVVRIIDPDMNLDPEAVDNFKIDVWSDSDAGGIDLTVTETNEATGIFEGTVFFTVSDESSGHRLRVSEGDTVTADYEDNTLPDPYTTADELNITATTLIGTVVPPLERAPAANLRTVDAFGNSLDTVSIDQQVQISADLANGQDREQAFAYLVQIQDENGVTVSLAWITGSLSAGQSFSPALSWIPSESGAYTATAFVWESVDNPTALSPPVSTTINVR